MRILVWSLGFAGVFPFVGLASAAWLAPVDWHTNVTQILSVYAAVFISFLGGVHWGTALNQAPLARRHLLWGVGLSLLAWGVALIPWIIVRLSVFILLLLISLWVDRSWLAGIGAPLNYGVLRAVLTAVASLSLLLAIGSYGRVGIL